MELKSITESLGNLKTPNKAQEDVVSISRNLLGDPSAFQLYKNVQNYRKIHFKICNFLHTLFYEWDDEKERMILLSSKAEIVKFHLFFHWAYTIATAFYFIATINKIPVADKILGMAFLASWTMCAVMQTVFLVKRRDVLFLFRAIGEFEDKYLPVSTTKEVKKDKVCTSLMTLGILSSFGLPTMMTVMLIMNPCRPPHLGYILFAAENNTCKIPNWPQLLIVLGIDSYLWVIAQTQGLFHVFQGLLVCVRCQDFYLQLLNKSILRKFEGIPRELSNQIRIKLYKEIQVLNAVFNNVFAPAFFPGVIGVGIFAAVMGMFACIKLRQVIPFPAIMFFPIIASDGLSIIFIAKIAGAVYIQSKAFLRRTRQQLTKERRTTAYKKTIKSMDTIKSRFGHNYVDELTPVIFLNFCFTQTVSLILLTDK